MGHDDTWDERALATHESDDIEIVHDIEVQPAPPPPPPASVQPPPPTAPPEPARRSRRWHLRWIVPLASIALVVVGYGFWTVRSATEGMKTTTTEFFTSIGVVEVDSFFERGSYCAGSPEFPADFPVTGPAPNGITWEVEITAYHLELGSGSTTMELSTFDEGALDAVDTLRPDRPGGTDYGTVLGRLDDGVRAGDVSIFLVRAPGADWKVCGIDDDR